MPRELTNATITHVSYVDKGANKKEFFLTKSAEAPVFSKEVKIVTKNDDAEQLVYGVVYEPDAVDAHGDFMTSSEIEKAAHLFMKEYQNIDTQHNFQAGAGEVVESYVAPADITVGDTTIVKGSWVLVTKATDEIWEQIQKGEITGYSMAGLATVTEVAKAEEETLFKSFMQTMKNFFTPVEKGEVKDAFYGSKKRREFYDAYNIFESVFFDELWSGDSNSIDTARVAAAATDFAELLSEIAGQPDLLKALVSEPIEKGDYVTVKKEDLQELMKEAVAPLLQRVEALEKSEGEEAPAEAEATPEGSAEATEAPVEKSEEDKQAELLKSFSEVVKEALAPITERLSVVEKARGISKQADGEGNESVKKSENIWAGLL